MPTVQPEVRSESDQPIKRRGLLAAAVALVAGFIAKVSETPVSAGTDGDVVPGAITTAAATTVVRMNTAYNTSGAALLGLRHTSTLNITPFYRAGVYGHSGSSTGAVGVYGAVDTSTNGIGVQGFGDLNGAGVFGLTYSGPGVLGQSTIGIPVFGQVPSGSSATTVGIYGENTSSSRGGYAIYGFCSSGHAVVGTTAGAAGTAGIVGTTRGAPGTYAAAFYGPVAVVGDFAVFNGAKSAAVPHPDGSHRRVYCLESPESWFEDFGEGRLDRGCAEVVIDPDLARSWIWTAIRCFSRIDDAHSDLCVTGRSAVGFSVQARDAGANTRFGWRVVAKRKDVAVERLQRVTRPAPPTPPAVVQTPTAPGTGS